MVGRVLIAWLAKFSLQCLLMSLISVYIQATDFQLYM